jgi:hypothetical protein
LQIPLDVNINELTDIPYTISFVIRKRQQIDNLNELPKAKQPTDRIIWDGTSEELEEWLEMVLNSRDNKPDGINLVINDIEGD